MNLRTVYLAGPGVFRRDADAYGTALKRRCRELGFEPLWPLDNKPEATEPAQIAREVREKNCAMIVRADAIIADISPFRGPNMDPGTAFEIGFAAALRKPVVLYTNSSDPLLERTIATHAVRHDGSRFYDDSDMEVEDFGLAENLMISTLTDRIYANFDKAVGALALSHGIGAKL